MYRIFVNQDPKSYAFEARSVRLAGYSTSVRLERQFWEILAEIAAQQGLTLPRLLSQLYSEALEIHGEVRNFASLLPNACVIHLKQGHQAPLAIAAEAGTKRRIRAVRLPSEPVSPEL